MNTIKTAVVTATLLAVGYGAHVVMNKPISPDSIWVDPPGVVLNSGAPNIQIPELEPSPDLAASSNAGGPGRTNPFAPPGGFGANPAPEAAPEAPGLFPANPGAAPMSPRLTGPGYVPEAGLDGTLPQVEPAIPLPHDTTRLVQTGNLVPVPTVSSPAFGSIWQAGQQQIAEGKLGDALFTLSMLYDNELSNEQRDQLIPLLDQLAGSVIYSRDHYLMEPIVSQGDLTLGEIAARFQVPVTYFSRVNNLAPGSVPVPGTPLKVVQGPFRAELSLSRRELTVFLGRSYAGRFNVSIGRDFEEQPMTYAVTEIAGAYQYVDQATGQPISAGDPSNPLGNHWIGLGNHQLNVRAGIHSVGAEVDASDSRGFISVSSTDADDLQALLSLNSTITVVP